MHIQTQTVELEELFPHVLGTCILLFCSINCCVHCICQICNTFYYLGYNWMRNETKEWISSWVNNLVDFMFRFPLQTSLTFCLPSFHFLFHSFYLSKFSRWIEIFAIKSHEFGLCNCFPFSCLHFQHRTKNKYKHFRSSCFNNAISKKESTDNCISDSMPPQSWPSHQIIIIFNHHSN